MSSSPQPEGGSPSRLPLAGPAPSPPWSTRRTGALLLVLATVLLGGGLALLALVIGGPSGSATNAGGLRRVDADGVALSIPRDWESFPLSPAKLEEMLGAAHVDPRLAAMIRGFEGNGKLFAYDPGDTASNVNVLRQAPAATNLPGVLARTRSVLQRQFGATGIQTGIVDLPAGRAGRLAYVNHLEVGGRWVSLQQIQYHLLAGRYDVVVTFSGTSVDPGRVGAMARTLEIEPSLLAPPGTQATLGHPPQVERGVELGL